jgi:hypothetical protein
MVMYVVPQSKLAVLHREASIVVTSNAVVLIMIRSFEQLKCLCYEMGAIEVQARTQRTDGLGYTGIIDRSE